MNNGIMRAMQTYVDAKIKDAGFDKTRTGIVLSRNINNTYVIRVDGIEYKGVKCVGESPLEAGTIVKVHIPNNQTSQMYINSTGTGLGNTLIYIDSSNGATFYNQPINTVLRPQVTYGESVLQTQADLIGAFGSNARLQWYNEDDNPISVADPFNFSVSFGNSVERVKYVVKLLVNGNEEKAQQYIVLGRLNSGTSGKSIGEITGMYLATNQSTGVTTSTAGFTSTMQAISADKRYLWMYVIIKYTDGTVASTTQPYISGVYGEQGGDGDAGTGVVSVVTQYLFYPSGTTAPPSNAQWSNTIDANPNPSYYCWQRTVTTFDNGNESMGTPILAEDINKAIGANIQSESAVSIATSNIKTSSDNLLKIQQLSTRATYNNVFNVVDGVIQLGTQGYNYINNTSSAWSQGVYYTYNPYSATYTLLSACPADWDSNYRNYYIIDSSSVKTWRTNIDGRGVELISPTNEVAGRFYNSYDGVSLQTNITEQNVTKFVNDNSNNSLGYIYSSNGHLTLKEVF